MKAGVLSGRRLGYEGGGMERGECPGFSRWDCVFSNYEKRQTINFKLHFSYILIDDLSMWREKREQWCLALQQLYDCANWLITLIADEIITNLKTHYFQSGYINSTLLSVSLSCPTSGPIIRPDSLLRLWLYKIINPFLLTYIARECIGTVAKKWRFSMKFSGLTDFIPRTNGLDMKHLQGLKSKLAFRITPKLVGI